MQWPQPYVQKCAHKGIKAARKGQALAGWTFDKNCNRNQYYCYEKDDNNDKIDKIEVRQVSPCVEVAREYGSIWQSTTLTEETKLVKLLDYQRLCYLRHWLTNCQLAIGKGTHETGKH